MIFIVGYFLIGFVAWCAVNYLIGYKPYWGLQHTPFELWIFTMVFWPMGLIILAFVGICEFFGSIGKKIKVGSKFNLEYYLQNLGRNHRNR